ncbi:hypothetical protein GCM10009854_14990 [Saccharopolyspora halophila]|uniref:Uncharacterized protein n=2 Tax=Saccharopolyspora halophila TaxID=405551 RepID=A0ABN3FX99_9PSEU
MSWNTYYQRKHAIAEVLDNARRDPRSALDTIPNPFTGAGELLAALHYKWMQQLNGRVEVALADTEHSPHGDRVEAVTTAWRRTAATNPALRDVLEHHAEHPVLRAANAQQHRMLALAAGLAEQHEDEHDIARVGQAFLHLLRATPAQAEERSRPGVLRKLIPSR